MAKKTPAKKKPAPVAKKSTTKSVSTPVRNSAIPKPTAMAIRKPLEITSEMIAKRAYEIHESGNGGSEQDNWYAAERALRSSI